MLGIRRGRAKFDSTEGSMVAVDPPMVARRRVRLALRVARVAAQLTQQQVADEMEWSLSKVIRIEKGEVSIAPNDLRPLLDYFGVDDGPHVKAMLDDARVARARRRGAWYQQPEFRPYVTESFRRLVDYEAKAAEVRFYSIYFMPEPLQTPEYAIAVSHLRDDEFSASQIRARVEATRRRRQALLARTRSVRLLVLLDESVLRRPIGGKTIFTAQLKELERLAAQRGVRIRMIPFSLDAPVTNNGSFDLVSLGDDDGGTVLYHENGMADDLIENGSTTARHLSRFDRVWRDATDERATTTFIRERISRLNHPAPHPTA
jgi:transcriptional regulator with XRE-family HTH domain